MTLVESQVARHFGHVIRPSHAGKPSRQTYEYESVIWVFSLSKLLFVRIQHSRYPRWVEFGVVPVTDRGQGNERVSLFVDVVNQLLVQLYPSLRVDRIEPEKPGCVHIKVSWQHNA